MLLIDDFLRKYTELENYFKKNNEQLKDKKEWDTYRQLRNIYTHQPDYRNGKMLVITQKFYDKFKNEVNEIIKPLCSENIMIPNEKIYKVDKDEYINNVIQTMIQKNYTCVPIVTKNGYLEGVFTANSLMLYFNRHQKEICEEVEKIKVENFMDYCQLTADSNVMYKFVKRRTEIRDIEKILQQGFNKNQRIEVIFITENGRSNEKILGLLTQWDLNKLR